MELFALPFALLGFIFATIAFSHATSASAKLERLEERMIESGILKEESATDRLSDTNSYRIAYPVAAEQGTAS